MLRGLFNKTSCLQILQLEHVLKNDKKTSSSHSGFNAISQEISVKVSEAMFMANG